MWARCLTTRSDFRNNNWNLNNRGSINAVNIYDYLDLVMYYITIIMIFVSVCVAVIIYDTSKNRFSNRYLKENYVIEITWIIVRSLILVLISVRSIFLLYVLDELSAGVLTIKVIAVQWYWIYEICDLLGNKISFNSYTLDDDSIELFRLIEVDNALYLRILTRIRLLVTSLDVILSFAIRSLGIKIDAIRSRLNSGNLLILRESIYIGFCSELCGKFLSGMNIVLLGTKMKEFLSWFESNLE